MKDVLLLQHDGFTADRRLDIECLNLAVFEATGITLQFEEAQVKAQPIDFTNLNMHSRSKPLPYKGFDDFFASFSGTLALLLDSLPPPYPEPYIDDPPF